MIGEEGLILLGLFLWTIDSLRKLFFWTYLWQRKEYRQDRIRAHFQTRQGKHDFFPLFFFLKLFLLVVFLFNLRLFYPWAFWLFYLVFGLESGRAFWQFFRRRLCFPQPTLKAILIMATSGLIACLIFFLFGPEAWVYFLVNLSLPVFLALAVFFWAPVTYLAKQMIISRAKKKLNQLANLKVIGITGSFGKTSTKEFLATILASKFKVLATFEHHNTPLGIARQILKELQQHQVYIVEMGAYKRGEIKEICDLVLPQIGIITGLGYQHLSLFGSFKDLLQAKFELIESLPKNGLAIFNGDSDLALKLANRTELKKLIYSLENRQVDFYGRNLKVFKEKIGFEIKKGAQKQVFEAKLAGRQNASNLLAAITAADYLGLSFKKIASILSKVKSLKGTMELLPGPKGLFLINDSYNSNPEGVLAALDYLEIFPKKKFMIFQPMIELGRKTLPEHQRVVRKAIEICELIFLTNRNFYSQLIKDLGEEIKEKLILEKSPRKALEKLSYQVRGGDVILFEGRETEKYLKLFLSIKND